VAVLRFHIKGSTLSLIHTEVPPALEGKGVASALARAGLDHAREHGMTVKPFCPFVAAYLHRHPEYQPLVDPDFAPNP
jgi:predicted GNAT family acetyltransferase